MEWGESRLGMSLKNIGGGELDLKQPQGYGENMIEMKSKRK